MKTWIYTQVLLHCVVLHYAVTFFVFKEEDLPEMPEGICFEYLTWKCLVCLSVKCRITSSALFLPIY